jgi:hypothetical protein
MVEIIMNSHELRHKFQIIINLWKGFYEITCEEILIIEIIPVVNIMDKESDSTLCSILTTQHTAPTMPTIIANGLLALTFKGGENKIKDFLM